MGHMRWPYWLIILGPLVALTGFAFASDSRTVSERVTWFAIGVLGVLISAVALRALLTSGPTGAGRTSRLWKCPGCGGIFAKGDPGQREFYERVLATGGRVTAPASRCPQCGARIHLADVYSGKYDVPE